MSWFDSRSFTGLLSQAQKSIDKVLDIPSEVKDGKEGKRQKPTETGDDDQQFRRPEESLSDYCTVRQHTSERRICHSNDEYVIREFNNQLKILKLVHVV